MAAGIVITPGQERCLYGYTMSAFEEIVGTMKTASTTSKANRDFTRFFLAGANDEIPDKQGRVTITAKQIGRASWREKVRVAAGEQDMKGEIVASKRRD